MGVTYKLRPDVREFVLQAKKTDPHLSCRSIANLITEKFQIQVSKSSINFLIKEAGMSMPVGRRLKKRRNQLPEPKVEILLEAPPEVKELTEIKQEPKIIPLKPPEEARPPIPLPEPAAQIIIPEKTEPLPEINPPEEVKPIEEVKPAPVAKPIEFPSEEEVTGAILLKGVDAFTQANSVLIRTLQNRFKSFSPELAGKIDTLVYSPLVGKTEKSSAYGAEIQAISGISMDIMQVVSSVFQEVREIKFSLSDASSFYLDGQLHTIWSMPYIPHDFSATIFGVKTHILKSFQEASPFVIFTAPGYDSPTKEFFDFLLCMENQKRISNIYLLGNKLEELESLSVERGLKRHFIIGVWPWQFTQCRRVKSISEFKPWHLEAPQKDYYIANIELELSLPGTNKSLSLWGAALKESLNDKIRIVILSNYSPEEIALEELSRIYLQRWPNTQEAFGDYSRKVELFTYMADSQRFFSIENLLFDVGALADMDTVFDRYIKSLDAYLRWHILPSGYESQGFNIVKERFYGLKATLKRQNGYAVVTFQVPPGFLFLKDLQYALNRLNEREAYLAGGLRLWYRL